MSSRSMNIKVGILIIVSIIIAGALVFTLGNHSTKEGFSIYVDFDFAGNLAAGSPVKISGIKMGRVESVEFMGGVKDPSTKRRVYVRAKIWIENRAKELVRTDSHIYINTQGLLGEQYIEIEPGDQDSGTSRIAAGSTAPIKGHSPPRNDLMMSKAYTLLNEVTGLLVSEKKTIGKTLKNSALLIEEITNLLSDNKGEIKTALNQGNSLLSEVEKSLHKANDIIGDGRQIKSSLNSTEYLLAVMTNKMPKLLNSTNKTLENVNSLLKLAGPKERDRIFLSLNHLDSLTMNIELVVKDSRKLLSSIASGKGSIGPLLVKRELYEDLKELVRDLRENPWKLFWKD